jgi:hypothetical protein
MPKYKITWVKHQTESIVEYIDAPNREAALSLATEPHATDSRWVMEDEPTVTASAELDEEYV